MTWETTGAVVAGLATVAAWLCGWFRFKSEVKHGLADVQGGLQDVKGELQGVKVDVDDVKRDLAAVKARLDAHLDALKDRLHRTETDISYLVRRIDQRDGDVSRLQADAAHLQRDLERILEDERARVREINRDPAIPPDVKSAAVERLASLGNQIAGKKRSLNAAQRRIAG